MNLIDVTEFRQVCKEVAENFCDTEMEEEQFIGFIDQALANTRVIDAKPVDHKEMDYKGDLISRNALIDDLVWIKEQVNSSGKDEVQEYIDRVEKQPSVDACAVVRCRECRYKFFEFKGGVFCKEHSVWFQADGFCNMGEREKN